MTTGTNGNYWYFCEFADRASDWEFSTQTTPTFYFCGATFNTTHWRSITHNDTDAKDGIGLGSKVVEHEAPVSLADDAEFGLPDASIGTGWFMSEDGDFLEISWTAAGVVSELNSNGNTAITDNDTDLCAYD
ncbi:hypothetical protein, partial [Herbaspirillum sp.]|uniref:hypothetical protein n=1 Tax=Herbaspirillum sp. TaxID=1890675 RepID=UPI0025846C75